MTLSRKISASAFVALVSAITLSGCGAKTKSSEVKITNGKDVKETVYPSVIQIKAMGNGLQGCTATFINHFQAVTAAHCLEGMKADDPNIFAAKYDSEGNQVTSFGADAFKIHPLYDPTAVPNPYDLAVVNFPRHAATKISLIASQRPKANVWVQLVGYGDNENVYDIEAGQETGSGSGQKRVGTNKLLAYDADMIRIEGVPGKTVGVNSGLQSCSGAGDSGGPMFFNSSTLIGISYGGGPMRVTADDGTISYQCFSLYVDLNNEENVKFLDSALEYDDLN